MATARCSVAIKTQMHTMQPSAKERRRFIDTLHTVR
jgi:hypothetical protein